MYLPCLNRLRKNTPLLNTGADHCLWLCAVYSGLCNWLEAAPIFSVTTSFHTTIFSHLHMVALVDRGEVKELVCVKPLKSTRVPQKKGVYKLSFQFRKIQA